MRCGPVAFPQSLVLRSPVILAADIGGTHARFMLARRDGARVAPLDQATTLVASHATLEDACEAFLQRAPGTRIQAACFAVAGPVDDRTARLTNAPWRIDADAIATRFAIPRLRLCNDFEAAAAGLDDLEASAFITLQRGTPQPQGPRLLIGAGTGLGVAYLLREGSGTRIVAGEGGHVGFAPASGEQIELLRFVSPALRRVSAEQLLSGAGLARLYAFAHRNSGALPADVRDEGAAAVVRRFDAGEPAALEALALFASIFGAVAGDHALSMLATGGVCVAGGLAPRVSAALCDGRFVAAFCDKEKHEALMARMPIRLVRDERLGLLGAARCALEWVRR